MNCIVYMVNYNYVIHAISLLAFMAYKYNELQMFSITQKLSYKASCKTPFFLIMNFFLICFTIACKI
jgi:hypothetical protein